MNTPQDDDYESSPPNRQTLYIVVLPWLILIAVVLWVRHVAG